MYSYRYEKRVKYYGHSVTPTSSITSDTSGKNHAIVSLYTHTHEYDMLSKLAYKSILNSLKNFESRRL